MSKNYTERMLACIFIGQAIWVLCYNISEYIKEPICEMKSSHKGDTAKKYFNDKICLTPC